MISYPIKGGNKRDESHQTYVPDIAWALQERDAKGADSDIKDGHLIVTHALSSDGADASEDGTGRGTPIIAAMLNSGGNDGGFRSEPDEHLVSVDLQNTRIGGDVAGSLDTSRPSRGGGQAVFALQHAQIGRKDDAGPQGKGYQEDLALTLDNRPSADVVVFDERNITSKENRSNPQPGDPCHTLHSDPPRLIAFSSKDHGADAGEIAPTLRSQNFDKSHINGGGQVAIAFGWNKSDSQTMRVDEETTDALQSSPQSNPAIAFESRVARNGRGAPEEIVPPLKAESGQTGRGDSAPLTAGNFGVRRLTPTECMRLQGFPDSYFDDENEKKILSDSAIYRCLGNAVAVPVVNWIARRILEVSRREEEAS